MKVLVAQPIPTGGIEMLKEYYDVEQADHLLSKTELIRAITDADALVCTSFSVIDKEVIAAAKKLKVVSNLAIGYDNINLSAAGEKGVAVTNTPGVLSQTVAELVFVHILALARKIIEADKYVRAGLFKQWSFELMVGTELKGKTLGLIGFGSIGQNLVPIAKGFGMKILYTNQHGELDGFKGDSQISFAPRKEDVLKKADFVVLMVPLTPQTKHLITYTELALMKEKSFLINISRGSIVKEADLVRALKEKKIAGAGLDVYEFEPQVAEELLTMSNTVLTPHIGSATTEARTNLSRQTARNVITVLSGETCENIVNRQYLR